MTRGRGTSSRGGRLLIRSTDISHCPPRPASVFSSISKSCARIPTIRTLISTFTLRDGKSVSAPTALLTMKLTRIETIRSPDHPNLVWVHLHTADGLIGLGETFYLPAAV